MTKLGIWLTVGILLPYSVFTTGLFYWASRCEVTDRLITPFSWALSAEERGFVSIATESDIDCVHWLLDEGDPDLRVACNVNGTVLLMGYMEHLGGGPSEDKPWRAINYIFLLDECYLFLTDWNTRHGEYIMGSDIGLRFIYPFRIEDVGDGCLWYVNIVPRLCGVEQIKGQQRVPIQEVYRSGNSVVYEKVTNVRDFYGMALVDNPEAQDVDIPILIAFLAQDKVDENGYELWEYDCKHFAHDLHNNAEAEGIRCAVVWTADRSHVFNAFEMMDRGIVFVDASTGIDGFAYDVDGKLVVDAKVREGIADSCIFTLGEAEGFTIEW